MLRKILLPALFLFSSSGCVNYTMNRLKDGADILSFQFGPAIGLSATVEATDGFHTWIGYSEEYALGFDGRQVVNRGERNVGIPLTTIASLADPDDPVLRDVPPRMNARTIGSTPVHACNLIHLGNASPRKPGIDKADIEVGGTAAVAHVRVGFHPGQLLDFLCGWFGLDPARDDGP